VTTSWFIIRQPAIVLYWCHILILVLTIIYLATY